MQYAFLDMTLNILIMQFKIRSRQERINDKLDRVSNWHAWFAWYPVCVNFDAYKDYRWLEIVWRRGDYWQYGKEWEYYYKAWNGGVLK